MQKIAIVVQRYGLEVNGGAELHARLLAEKLNTIYNVDVLTTCAIEYQYWDNHYAEGSENINGVTVHRFKTEKKDFKKFKKIVKLIYRNYKYKNKQLKFTNFIYVLIKRLIYNENRINFQQWLKVQGPYCPKLVNYIDENKKNYSAFIFFTYLYYPTNVGILPVAEKSILIPTAHDEPPFHFQEYKNLFQKPKFIMYNLLSEKKLVENTYKETQHIQSDIAGVGFDMPEINKDVLSTLDIDFPYFVYIGRIDNAKGCDTLVEYFNRYCTESNTKVKLLMIGKNFTELKASDHVTFTGFISDEEKNNYILHSQALIIPSKYESLSMVTLEAMLLGKPVLANKQCEVIKEHIESSNAGFLYESYSDFESGINTILKLTNTEKEEISERGFAYVNKNFKWDVIINKFKNAIEYIKN